MWFFKTRDERVAEAKANGFPLFMATSLADAAARQPREVGEALLKTGNLVDAIRRAKGAKVHHLTGVAKDHYYRNGNALEARDIQKILDR